MESHKRVDSIISSFTTDLQNNRLEAMESWMTNMNGYYQNNEQPISKQPS